MSNPNVLAILNDIKANLQAVSPEIQGALDDVCRAIDICESLGGGGPIVESVTTAGDTLVKFYIGRAGETAEKIKAGPIKQSIERAIAAMV